MASPKETHGPIVKTGPTAGKVRSRNKDGRWRAKRSDAGVTRSNTTNKAKIELAENIGKLAINLLQNFLK